MTIEDAKGQSLPKAWKLVKLGEVCWVNREERDPAKEVPNEEFIYIDISGFKARKILEVKKILGRDAPAARRVVHSKM
ncbi:MAG: hypothetical protein RMH75_07305 [Archaeoglobaceae archaeon]|nr:hypothetical protein [Archaeoglobaceae archaeon]